MEWLCRPYKVAVPPTCASNHGLVMERFFGAGKVPVEAKESSPYKAAVLPVPPVVELWNAFLELVDSP